MNRRKAPIWIGVIVSSYFLIGVLYFMATNNDDALLFYPVGALVESIFENKDILALLNHLYNANIFIAIILSIGIILQIVLAPGALATLFSLGICKLIYRKARNPSPL